MEILLKRQRWGGSQTAGSRWSMVSVGENAVASRSSSDAGVEYYTDSDEAASYALSLSAMRPLYYDHHQSSPITGIDEFKKSGEFDRLRRELLSHFQRSDRTEAFKSHVDDIARQRLSSDPKLISMPNDAVQRELLGEIDRFARSNCKRFIYPSLT
ncbi:hypothetical protein DFH29DRAFT_504610 [Suillus ampliporus]|nr:hypothetical protein DFH29DRAFT_504610 [Suillus ampliporus]